MSGVARGTAEDLEFVPEVDRPNVVWIVLDTCRADHLSCYGYGRNTTPNIDRLAARGVVFERHYAQAPSTPQSVPIYMTGRYTAVLYQDPWDVDIWWISMTADSLMPTRPWAISWENSTSWGFLTRRL